MHKLLNVVQEFTVWCEMHINVKKPYLLVTDNDKKRREQEPAPLLTINGETLQATFGELNSCELGVFRS